MFLYNRHLLIYDHFTFGSYQTNDPFWLPKSIKIDPQTYKFRYWFFDGFLNRFVFDFGSSLGAIWEVVGRRLGSKPGNGFLGIALQLRLCIFFALEAPRWPYLGPFWDHFWPMYRKYRYEMTFMASIYRFLSIGLALAKLHVFPPSWTFLMVMTQSRFRIGKYDTKSASTDYACINAVPWILSIFQVIEVDFISISFDRIGPRLEGTFTIYRKIRYDMRVSMHK